jgi:hypothetical protein
MKTPTTAEARERLATGYALDRLWGETMGLPGRDSKERSLLRSALDIDLAVPTYADVPRDALLEAGFEHTGRLDHSDNWRARGPGPLKQRTAVQFSAEDERITDAVEHASSVDLDGGVPLRVATVADLIVLKLAAAAEPKRRPSKREHDVADVLALLEDHPELRSPELVARVQQVRRRLLSGGDEP